MENSGAVEGIEYWLQWQVLLCALIFVLPTALAVRLLRKRGGGSDPLKPVDLWAPCWRNLHPRWLLFYRAFAFIAMAYLLYETVAAFGFFVFFFYTQWTFALVLVYFAIATVVSIRGCRRKPIQTGEKDNLLKKDMEEKLGFLENLLQIIYQTSAGAVMLTDIVFWCLLLPFMSGENFKLTLLIGCMHSVNAVFLIIESAVNRMPFTWFGLIYFVLWSCSYVVFQWAIHACCVKWWPYPFLDLSTPWAPLWYLALALVHIPCYGLYVLLTKAKHAVFSTWFTRSFVRFPEKKEI
ncbi:uncharacterized protein LOC131007259 [Salvia miltiorrhiza]|uniref:uncharacterized protein LOC131007259 n=1 Tax=Salvia miltiorrhiza TaxID=226208 RepID=UPI0025AC610A|nr:uncharacterized protein LOC131007259 [Salvia miltiorrhiza]XP_057790397.1 uncharacterized protein LOC131007259 [Salvia miltiorrhiza]